MARDSPILLILSSHNLKFLFNISFIVISMEREPQGYRNRLNNKCQFLRLAHRYEDTKAGPEHQPTWTSAVYVNGVEYGRATGRSRDVAREAAAQIAFEALV
ncbi:hypothetical protein BDQ12DRAFT_738303 [Crucibulum laeve]|uniref:DRBM domain-containing protein n=1 Tax=Crucibulum laeve TaxID=68775 RepID=A0A5C3LZM7_9AGAR|nr:hypothetical protein BDQ12DRAFT_738303 [Crucibulum laeve]